MNTENLQALLEPVVAISQQAGAAILEIYQQDFNVVHKDDASPLTQADLASHRLICAALKELTPDIPLLSEESAALDYSERSAWNEYWLIDPLDGTKEFIKRNGEFTVNIALIRDHQPVLGVVYVPVSNTCYAGIAGNGATVCTPEGGKQDIRVRLPSASPAIVVGSRSHANPVLAKHLAAIGPHEMVSMGSSLKFCLVAEGKADFYPRLGPTSEWDTAAAHAVVTAAGGKVVTLDGQDLRYNTKDSLLNPEFLVIADPNHNWLEAFSDYRPPTA